MSSARLGDWLGGVGAATWLFLPIAASSIDGRLIMMWQPGDTAELLAAWAIVAVIAAACLAVARLRRPAWVPRLVVTQLRGLLTTSSLLVVPFVAGLAALPVSGSRAHATLEAPAVGGTAASTCSDIDVVLLDELSYGAVFGADGQPSRASVAALASSARVYLEARSPSTSTLRSVGSYLLDLPASRVSVAENTPVLIRDNGTVAPIAGALADRGLFHEAKRLGYRTEVFGWYFPYCGVLGDEADTCHAISMYDVSTLDDDFSPKDPFLTVANMWPYQWPTGLFKRPAAAWFQRETLDKLRRLAATPPGPGPVLRWVHFNVPHRPWIEGNGWIEARAFEESPRRYEAQLQHVDLALGSFLDGLRSAGRYDAATVVLIADHGARDGLGPDDPLRVPLVVRAPHQTERQDIRQPVEARRILNDVFSVACHL